MVLELPNQLFPLLEWSLAPLLKRLLRRNNSIIDVLLGTDWDVPELLAGSGICAYANISMFLTTRPTRSVLLRRIEMFYGLTLVLILAAARLAVDKVGELVPLDGRDLRWRHNSLLIDYSDMIDIVVEFNWNKENRVTE